MKDRDPAARSSAEILLLYSGLHAILAYRLSHMLYKRGYLFAARLISQAARHVTGIEIHPGAKIGKGVFIDHGSGVVIGETAVVGNNCTLYQGVTLGALSFPKDSCGKIIKGHKRHPTIEDNVIIYAGSTILGGDTVIGHHTIIGGNVWLTESVPAHSRVYHRPEVIIREKRKK